MLKGALQDLYFEIDRWQSPTNGTSNQKMIGNTYLPITPKKKEELTSAVTFLLSSRSALLPARAITIIGLPAQLSEN